MSQPDPPMDNAALPSCTVEVRRIGEVSVVAVTGTLDMLTAPRLESGIGSAAGPGSVAVVVDLSKVDFLASAGMGVLVAAHAELAPAVRLVVVADGPATSRPMKLIGLTDIVDLFATLEEALTAVAT